MKAFLHWAPVGLGVVFLLMITTLQSERVLSGKNDFAAFYAGGTLAGTPDLYSAEANVRLVEKTLGVHLERTIYIRHPFYAVVLKPLAYLPYRAAYGLFTLATLGAFLWFVIRFYKECPALPFFAAFSLPMAIAEWNGQDPAFLVAIVGASILLMRARRDFLAGLVFSLCLLKPHLFLFVALLLLLKKRWPMIAGGATGVAALTLLGVAYNGVGSIPGWIATMQNPWINGEAAWMPNLHGLTAALDAPAVVEPVLIALTVALFLWLTRKVESFELLFAAALLCGLLANVHAALSDDILLMPVMVLVTGATQCKSLRIASALVLTPVPYFLAMAGPPYGALVPIALLVQLSLFGVAAAAKNYDATSSRVITSV